MAAVKPFDKGQSGASQLKLPRSCPKRILGNPAERQDHPFSLFTSVGHPDPPAKYSIDSSFKLSKLAQFVLVSPGIRTQKGQRYNFTREPPCLQQSNLGVPVRMKPSLTNVWEKTSHGRFLRFVYSCRIN